jgi:hypothetical protein
VLMTSDSEDDEPVGLLASVRRTLGSLASSTTKTIRYAPGNIFIMECGRKGVLLFGQCKRSIYIIEEVLVGQGIAVYENTRFEACVYICDGLSTSCCSFHRHRLGGVTGLGLCICFR